MEPHRMKTFPAFAVLALLTPMVFGAEPTLPPDTKVLRDLAYVSKPHEHQKLDLYLPASPKGPLLVWIHGGGWRAGSKSEVEGLPMLAQGFTIASVEYRFSHDALFPAQIEDCKAAIRWLRAHAKDYGYDPKRIAAWGPSAGGHLTALLATTARTKDFDVGENLDQSSAIRCGIDLFGPADFPGWKPPSADPMVQRSGADSVLVQLFGGPIDEKLKLARRASPVTWVNKESAPLYILHGNKDPLVGLDQSMALRAKYKDAGIEVLMDVINNGGHGGPGFFDGDRPARMLEFLSRHLAP
jgi:acetyl esterase/lipase